MPNYSATEKRVFDYVNELRKDPTCLNSKLEAMKKNFSKNYYKIPGTNINVITSEGVKAVEEAIEFL